VIARRARRGLPLLLLGGSALLGSVAADETERAAPEPGVRTTSTQSARRMEVVLPGQLISYGLPSRPDGTREIVVLVASSEKPTPETDSEQQQAETDLRRPPCPDEQQSDRPKSTALYRIGRGDPGTLDLLLDDLPGDCRALDAAELDGDGSDQLLLGCRGALWAVSAARDGDPPRLRQLLEDPELDWVSLHPRVVLQPELDRLPAVTTVASGKLNVFGSTADSNDWEPLAQVALRVEGKVGSSALLISTRIPLVVGRGAGGGVLFATPPEAVGQRRIRTELIELSPGGELSVTENWSRLPEPEQMLERGFLRVDGRPVLWVATKPANKLSLFGEKRLRLYELERDRSRLGFDALFAQESRMNIWQPGTPKLYDVNADGRDDLVIGYWKGLMGSSVVLDAYLRTEDGSFGRSPRSTELEIKKGDRSFVQHGRDLDGDGLPDLLVRGRAGLLLYRGRSSTNGKKLVQGRPLKILLDPTDDLPEELVIEVSSGDGAPRLRGFSPGQPGLADLDGDDRPEILLVQTGHPGRLAVIWPASAE
jgi:hypothetical protein